MLYLIPSKSIINIFLSTHELIEVQDFSELRAILFPSITDRPSSFNADVVISYAALKRLTKYDTNRTKKHTEEELEVRIKKIGNYKKRNIDIFILETSKKNYDQTCAKLMELSQKLDVQFDTLPSICFFKDLEASFEHYYSKKANIVVRKNILNLFFKIKNKYNKSKIPNMNRLTTSGLSKFDEWFFTDYIPYKHVASFARTEMKIPIGTNDEEDFYRLFGYKPSDTDFFSSEFYDYLKKLIKKNGLTVHKLGMLCKYYLLEKCECYYDYKPSFEYIILGQRKTINRTFLIYISIALGLTASEIKKLFKLGNCVLTDFLKEDILLLFFAENQHIMDNKQRGCLFNYLWESK